MGLFDDFDIDLDEVKEAGGFDFEDGTYDFVISEALTQNGTKKDPDDTKFVIKYDLDEHGTYWEWFTIAVDGDSEAAKAKQSLSFLKGRLLDLGFSAAQLNDLDPSDLEGIEGALTLKTKSGSGKNAGNKYQNISKVVVATVEGEVTVEEPEFDAQEAKRRVAAKQAARTAPAAAPAAEKKAPVRRRAAAAPAADEDQENPFGE